MNRRHFLSALASSVSSSPLLAQDEHPVVNDDSAHHGDHIAGVNAATEHSIHHTTVAPASSGIQFISTRTGSNLRYGAYHETRLTPAVVKGGLHRLGELKMTGDARGMEAQPLFAPGIVVNNQRKDLVLCATMANRIYAFDAHTYKTVWMTKAGTPVKGSKQIDMWQVNDHFGILSTPEIVDDHLYAVTWISPNGSKENASHVLIEVRLTDGKITRRLTLTQPSNVVQRKQRGSLCHSKTNGKRTLFVPWGTIQETAANAHGFITAIDIDAWNIAGEINLSQGGSGAGVWMAGQAPTLLIEKDADGKEVTYLLFLTGNGDFNPAAGNFSECFIKLRYDGNFTVIDWWSPWRDVDRGAQGGWNDMDLAAGGITVIPEYGLILGAGKDSILYSLDWRRMGKTTVADLQNPELNYAKLKAEPIWFGFFAGFGVSAAPNDPKMLNKLFYNKTHHQHGSPIYWPEQKLMYTWCENGNLRVGKVAASGIWKFLARSEEVASPYSPVPPGGMPGAMMCLSHNGDHDGVLWACVPDKDANREITTSRVFAFDAANFGEKMADGDTQIQRLWMSDPPHVFNKFNPPIVNDGRLWVPCYDGSVQVWGV
jgi:outer membrane protein assembly factor BamB